ncbi:MAG: YegS/Rv2252/BmrU family lipid kinase [Leptolyngbyaceae cyanobacterium SL_1_1]|nr:YegS/Rv2252/BmrU family lipid kinase [Leptolyngbyaceae cyanobacterium RM1_1_2]NJO11087.1 YegS/Rv2252/BmrU family lipid kinase [Leptolyngbyaceae cyanobacterium SL_1_1]
MSQKVHLIFNPAAGKGDADTELSDICSRLQSEFELSVHKTTPELEADSLAHQAVEQGAEIIIVSGGDGTVSCVTSALIDSEICLGIIPRGTANAFAKALSIPENIAGACEVILTGAQQKLDMALCNERPMLLLAGIGFEAKAVERTDRKAKNRFGPLAYLIAGIRELKDFDRFDIKIETEAGRMETSAAAVTIANAAPATSVLAQGPDQIEVDDGLLDITIVAPESVSDAIAASYELLRSAITNSHAQHNNVGHFRAKQIRISTDPPQKVVLDGEVMGETPIEVKCLPSNLTVFVPVSEVENPEEKFQKKSTRATLANKMRSWWGTDE